MVQFEWDENKNQENIKKHGISFQEAQTVFRDKGTVIAFDENHSGSEDRFLIIGFSIKLNLLIVCHCYRQNNTIIRIISARKVTKSEAIEYEKNKKWNWWDWWS